LDKLLVRRLLALAPVVLVELLSDPALPVEAESLIRSLPVLTIADGYWERAGKLRGRAARHGFMARLADILIAQSCLDHGVPLLTRDKGFGRLAKVGGPEIGVARLI
jgi:predicted nucleic acid-binding protein